MTPKEQLIDALRALCAMHGGHVAIADKIGVNEQTLYQILAGVKLPSGEPRGVGPAVQRKLQAHYPNWSSLRSTSARGPGAIPPPRPPPPDFKDEAAPTLSEWATIMDIRMLPPDEQDDLRQQLHDRSEKFRAYRDLVIAEAQSRRDS